MSTHTTNVHAASALDKLIKIADRALSMPENGVFPSSIDGLRVLATEEGRRTPSGKGESRTSLGCQVARISNSQEGHRVSRRVPNSHEDIDSRQDSASGVRQKRCQMFLRLISIIFFLPFNAVLGILCHLTRD